MMKLPGLHELQAFEAAARLASFARAARELHVTESAISHRIRTLEADLGSPLFIRGPRCVALTPAGEAYRGSVREAFDALAQAQRSVEALRAPSLSIAVPAALGARTLGPMFAQFHLEQPEVRLRIAATDPEAGHHPKGDIVIVFGAQVLPGYEAIAEIRQEYGAVAAPGYLAALGIREPQGLHRAVLLRHPALSWPAWFRSAGMAVPGRESTGPLYEDATMMLESAVCGLGVALCPELAASAWIRAGQLAGCFGVRVPAPPCVVHRARACASADCAEALARWLARRLAELVGADTAPSREATPTLARGLGAQGISC